MVKSTSIKFGYIISEIVAKTEIEQISLKGKQEWYSPVDGSSQSGVIVMIKAKKETFNKLNLSRVQVDLCFNGLKGKCFTNPFNPKKIM